MHITDLAREKVIEIIDAKGYSDLALRVGIQGRGPGGFQYQLQFVREDTATADDEVIDAGRFKVFIDSRSAPDLEGATLDFVEEVNERGFKIDNPNPLWRDPLAMSVQQVLDTRINPAVAAHGGYVSLLDVKDQIAYIQLGGGCQGCGMVDVTLRQGIEVMIKEAIPEIAEIVDATDHAAGSNPYYQPAKGGGPSPFG